MMCLKGLVQTRRIFGILFFLTLLFFSQNAFGAITIQGTIFDKRQNPLIDIDVELLNDYYQAIQRTRTDGAGKYSFNVATDGRYTLRVLAFRYDYQDQEVAIDLQTQGLSSGTSGAAITQGSGFFQQDVYLLPKKGGLKDSELSVIFAQQVPKPAEKLYEKAIKDLANKKTNDGILGLNEAVKVFPEYYDALHRLGMELFKLKKYQESAQCFVKAVEVNPKSATSFYYLGYALHLLNKDYNKAALAALNQAFVLAPGSQQVLFMLGKIERAEGNFENAEKYLLQAKKLMKSPVPEIHMELVQLYSNELKKYNEAADELEIYIKNVKMDDAEQKKFKKMVGDLREKAKLQSTK